MNQTALNVIESEKDNKETKKPSWLHMNYVLAQILSYVVR